MGRTRTKARSNPKRVRLVWAALIGCMTTVGGLFWAIQGGPAPRLDGIALPALVSAAGPSTIESIFATRAPFQPAQWQAIVIHHSASVYGTPASIEAQHRAMNLDGLGFHFVIGNGNGLDDGEVHVGFRWLDQLPGAHAAGPRGDWLNRNSIGICLVGDGNRRAFTDEQIQRLAQLVDELAVRCNIPRDRIYRHSDVASTNDPGRFFPAAAFRDQLVRAR